MTGEGIFTHRNIAKEAKCTYYLSPERCTDHGSRFKWTHSNYFLCCQPSAIDPTTHTRMFLPELRDIRTNSIDNK